MGGIHLKGLIGFRDEHGFAVNVLSFNLREGNRTALCKILSLLDCVYLLFSTEFGVLKALYRFAQLSSSLCFCHNDRWSQIF
jgi:hypothetical protein